jgi:hypothetical protein
MRIWGTVLLIGIVCGLAFPQTETGADLATRAKSVPLDHQPELYTRAAWHEVKLITQLYNDGKTDEAAIALKDLVSYADSAADTATRSHKRIKNTEIDLRKMAEKLRDLKRTLNFDDQPAVQAANDHLENLRTNLLSLMFGKEKK